MRFAIVLAPQAVKGCKALRADFALGVRDAIELHLRHEPTKVSKSRIKRLRGLDRPQYRLRVDEVRVFYDVTETSGRSPCHHLEGARPRPGSTKEATPASAEWPWQR